jgi:hypothetical protein
MTHASLASDVLFWFIIAAMLLLAAFVIAAIRAPMEASRPFPRPAAPPEAAPPEPALAPPPLPRRRAASPPADAPSQSNGVSYPPRHAASGGPPWGPAPKPPGIDQDVTW